MLKFGWILAICLAVVLLSGCICLATEPEKAPLPPNSPQNGSIDDDMPPPPPPDESDVPIGAIDGDSPPPPPPE